jgi:adenosylcobyric acid synthase
MNPVLLKPEADNKSQVVVLGKVDKTLNARDYYKYTPHLLEIIKDSLQKLMQQYEIIVIEGAGSPAEINLKSHEIVNMRVADLVNAPVLLVGDIDRGGVFASLTGTIQLLDDDERKLVKGLIINKFRGDIGLLEPGLKTLEELTQIPVIGVIPYFSDISIAQEDAVFLEQQNSTISGKKEINVAIIQLPRISNYDDFDPLKEMGCNLIWIREAHKISDVDLIIIPGTKSTVSDLHFMESKGITLTIIEKARQGVPVIGICGGYQMLGNSIYDPDGIESRDSYTRGLGLLDMETVFQKDKTTTRVKAELLSPDKGLMAGFEGIEVEGYEIHSGINNSKGSKPLFKIKETPTGKADYYDGSINDSGNVMGTYIHGIFHNIEFTNCLLSRLRQIRNLPGSNDRNILNRQDEYNKLAELVRKSLDMNKIYSILKREI